MAKLKDTKCVLLQRDTFKKRLSILRRLSPIAKFVTVRCLITLIIKYSWNLYQLDTSNSFLYGEIQENVYMTLLGLFFEE